MKRLISILLCFFVLLWLPAPAMAEGESFCTISAGSDIHTLSGKTISVPITISNNPGFTNFAIGLEYDKDKLQLIDIQLSQLSPKMKYAVNPAWRAANNNVCAFITMASPTLITEQGTLFTANFKVSEDFAGTSEIKPVLYYLKSNKNADVFPEFVSIQGSVEACSLIAIIPGDINIDGVLEYDDVMLAYMALEGEAELTEQQLEIADVDGDGKFKEKDLEAIYLLYTGGM